MYTRLEEKLSQSLLNGSTIELQSDRDILLQKPLVKVSGRAEIEDYERLQQFFKDFNRLGEIITFSNASNDPQKLAELRRLEIQALQPNLSKDQQRKIEKDIEKLLNLKQNARQDGLAQSPILIQNLVDHIEMFHPSGYNILITPHDKPQLHYRGEINKQWLRASPQSLLNLYGGQSEAPWTMVGLVTHVQGTYVNQQRVESDEIVEQEALEPSDNPMMLDNVRQNFRNQRVFDRQYLESNDDFEIIVSPVAVYREFSIVPE